MVDIALAAQVMLFLLVLGVLLASGQASIYHPLTVYLLFHLVVFVIRPILVLKFGFEHEWDYMGLPASERLIFRAFGVSSLGLVVLSLTCLFFGKCRPQFHSVAPAPFSASQRRALLATTLILGPFVLYSIQVLLTGGLQGEDRNGTFIMTGSNGYAVEAQYMAGPLICAWLCLLRFRWYAVLTILVPYVAYRSWAGMSRWTFVLLFVALALTYAWQKRAKWILLPVAVTALPLFLFFTFLGDNRDVFKAYFAGQRFEPKQVDSTLPAADRFRRKYDNPDFANFDFLTYTVSVVPEKTGMYTYGLQYLQLFTEPIPRKLWPDKPVGSPVPLFNINAYGNFVGRTVSLVGDGWMNGGWVGLIITVGIVGTLLGLAHRWFWNIADKNNIAALVYMMGLPMCIQWFRDGGISIAKFVFWNLSPLLLWVVLTWLLGQRRVPAYSVLLPRGAVLRFRQAIPSGSDAKSNP
jgi:hypothetical protein